MVKIENIKVAVRVRPFNDREKSKECKNIVSMVRRSTILSDPTTPTAIPRAFTFDHSYWSHDGFKESPDGYLEPATNNYIDQRRLFEELGTGILENVWAGYNCTLFAYGQTGSGKSYSMMGYDVNKGMIPQLCEKLYEEIATKRKQKGQDKTVYQVHFSMLEIYNEKVRDLLNQAEQPKQGLPVRMSQTKGFYVEGLAAYPVAAYRDIYYHIEEGNKNRTLAATKMNETSSRAHTIVILHFAQNFLRENKTTQSKIYLVDLAGSERAHQTGATGIRFEESKNINKSLMTLGIVIKNLCHTASGRTNQGPAPHRDSKLTLLLKDAIGGNCKTIMIATISPSDENYEQTLSTLRYADRVKSIRNSVKMNVAATDKLIKELLAEKEQLLAKLKNKPDSNLGYSQEEIIRMRDEQMAEIERIKSEMNNAEAAWERRLQETTERMEAQIAEERKEEKERAEIPHIWNLNEDPALSGKVYYLIKQGSPVTIGNRRATIPPTIELRGPSIAREHAVLTNVKGAVKIKPIQGAVKINGKAVVSQKTLKHQDRIYFGISNIFVFHHPDEESTVASTNKEKKKISYELAQIEISKHTKVNTEEEQNFSWLKQEVAEMLARTQDANAMAIELNKEISFEPVVVARIVLGETSTRAKVYVRVKTGNGGEFLWGRNTFLDRYDLMMDVFQKYENGEKNWESESKAQDPFWEPLETPTLIGVAYVPTECIAYMLDIQDQKVGIYDYESCLVGYLTVSLVPCAEDGHDCGEDRAVEEPIDLAGRDIAFRLKIEGATGIPRRFKSSWCQYSFYMEKTRHYSDEVEGVVPKYKLNQLHIVTNISHEMICYLEDASIMIEIYGRQTNEVASEKARKSLLSAYTIADQRRMSSSSGLNVEDALLANRRGSNCRMSSDALTDTSDTVPDPDPAISTVNTNLNLPEVRIAGPDNDDSETTEGSGEVNNATNGPGFVSENTVSDTEDNRDEIPNPTAVMAEMRRGIGKIVDEVMARRKMDDI